MPCRAGVLTPRHPYASRQPGSIPGRTHRPGRHPEPGCRLACRSGRPQPTAAAQPPPGWTPLVFHRTGWSWRTPAAQPARMRQEGGAGTERPRSTSALPVSSCRRAPAQARVARLPLAAVARHGKGRRDMLASSPAACPVGMARSRCRPRTGGAVQARPTPAGPLQRPAARQARRTSRRRATPSAAARRGRRRRAGVCRPPLLACRTPAAIVAATRGKDAGCMTTTTISRPQSRPKGSLTTRTARSRP